MAKPLSSLRSIGLQPYSDPLTPEDAAAAIQAARLNALDLLASAKLLHEQGRFHHSTALCVLALEEAGKPHIVMSILTGLAGPGQSCETLWRAYRRHTAKTGLFNFAIEMRAGVHFPDLGDETLAAVKANGPSPEDLDAAKQLGLYSDCFKIPEGVAVHLPRNVDCRERSEALLGEAAVVVNYLRDYPPDELEVWARHAAAAREKGLPFREAMKAMYQELVEKRFITAEQWAPIWKYLDDLDHRNIGAESPDA
jgi:AbiV family abortive infection protein